MAEEILLFTKLYNAFWPTSLENLTECHLYFQMQKIREKIPRKFVLNSKKEMA